MPAGIYEPERGARPGCSSWNHLIRPRARNRAAREAASELMFPDVFLDFYHDHTIYVQVERLLVRHAEDEQFHATDFIVSFTFDAGAGIIAVEYLKKENGDLQSFGDPAAAVDTAIAEARKRIDIHFG